MARPGAKSTADVPRNERQLAVDAPSVPRIASKLDTVAAGQVVDFYVLVDGGKAPFSFVLTGDPSLSIDLYGHVTGFSSGIDFTVTVTDADGRVTSLTFSATGSGGGVLIPPAGSTILIMDGGEVLTDNDGNPFIF